MGETAVETVEAMVEGSLGRGVAAEVGERVAVKVAAGVVVELVALILNY